LDELIASQLLTWYMTFDCLMKWWMLWFGTVFEMWVFMGHTVCDCFRSIQYWWLGKRDLN